MFPLDPRTLDKLAEVIVDMNGPYNRTGRNLAALLEASRWQPPPIYDGTPRIPWLRDQLDTHNNDSGELERLICRVCDPIEYDDGPADSEPFRQTLNDRLRPEHLVVTLVAGRPVLGTLGDNNNGDHPIFTEPADLRKRLENFITDSQTVDVLMGRVTESHICANGGAYRMATVAIGTFIEGLLLAVSLEHDEDLRTRGFPDIRKNRNSTKRIPPDFVPLELLIDTAYAKHWVQLDATTFAHQVRDFRNFIHPRKEINEHPEFDADTVMLCWGPVQALLNDLEHHFLEKT